MTDASGVTDPSGSYHMYCMLCDEVINTKDLCPHQGINIEHFLKSYVDEVNGDIANRQKSAKSISFYLHNAKLLREGKQVSPFNILNIYGFKNFVLSKFIKN